jgi:hypothetical protein
MHLSSFTVEKAKSRVKPFKLKDGDGLHILINPNSSRLWRFRYRHNGMQKMISFGSFPEVSLAQPPWSSALVCSPRQAVYELARSICRTAKPAATQATNITS